MDNRFDNSHTVYYASYRTIFKGKKGKKETGGRGSVVSIDVYLSVPHLKKCKRLCSRAQENEQPEPEVTLRGIRKRRSGFMPQERSGNNYKEATKKDSYDYTNHVYEKPVISGGLWTDNDMLELIKYVKKYPGGTPERWEKIASIMNRTVAEVTHMAKKVIIM